MNIYSIGQRENFIIILLSNILMLSLPFIMTIYFDAHDDALMLLFASGAYTGKPESHLIYNNIIYGYVISGLYNLTSKIEWYTLVQYFTQVISFNVFLYHILQLDIPKIKKHLYTVMLMGIAILLLIRPQYTFVSSEVSLASIVLIFNKRNKLRYVFSFLLFFLACNLRITGALIPYIIIGPLIVIPFISKIKQNKNYFFFLMLLLSTCCLLFLIDRQVYKSDHSWRKYTEYNAARQYIIDNPSKKKYLSNIQNIDKYLEYDLIVNYGIFDGSIIKTKDMQESVDYIKKYTIDNIIYNIYPYSRDYKQAGLIVICLFLFIQSLFIRKRIDMLYMLCFFSFILANIFCMSRSTSKIYLSMSLSIPLLFTVVCFHKKTRGNVENISSILIILFIGYRIYFTNNWNKNSINEREPIKELMERSQASKISFLQGGMSGVNAFRISQSVQGQKYFCVGWATNSPHNSHFYKNFTSYVNGLPILISEDNMKGIERIQSVLRQHYKINTKIDEIDKSGKFRIIKLIAK